MLLLGDQGINKFTLKLLESVLRKKGDKVYCPTRHLSRSDGRPGWEKRQPDIILPTLLTPITRNWQSMGILRFSTANQKNVLGKIITEVYLYPSFVTNSQSINGQYYKLGRLTLNKGLNLNEIFKQLLFNIWF